MNTHTGRLITISGGEGSGKSSQIKRLARAFPDAVFTREPGGTEFAEAGRALFLGPLGKDTGAFTQLCFTFGCSNDHLRKVVAPAVARGALVFSDRFCKVCAYAYQIYAGDGRSFLDVYSLLASRNDETVAPTLSIIIDVDPEEGLRRVAHRKGVTNHFDERKIEFHRKVREGYLEYARLNPETTVVINGNPSEEEVWNELYATIMRALEK